MEDKLIDQGTIVFFEIHSLKGYGKIVGLATNGNPIIGRAYIIEPELHFTIESYPYSHFVAFENQFKIVDYL